MSQHCFNKHIFQPVKQSEQQKKQSACERLGVLVDKPKYPEYALESARENSFKNWPKDSNIRVQDLVKAGFFFVGEFGIVFSFLDFT